MNRTELFYLGAAIYLNLDSTEVDAILAEAGLQPRDDNLPQCRAAVHHHLATHNAFPVAQPSTWIKALFADWSQGA